MTKLEINKLQKGDLVLYQNYIQNASGNIVELGYEVLEFLELGNMLVEAREISNGCAFIYISHERLISRITKSKNPEYFL